MESDDTSPATGSASTGLGLDENVEGALAYLVGLLSGVALYFLEDNEFVRFHAAQSIVASLVVAAVVIGVNLLATVVQLITIASGAPGGGPLAGVLSAGFRLLSVGIFLVVVSGWLFLMLRAFQGQRYRVPVVAKLADAIV
ncbi:MAG: DUF4870 domain-containing protein [Haloferacaceae archaeon]